MRSFAVKIVACVIIGLAPSGADAGAKPKSEVASAYKVAEAASPWWISLHDTQIDDLCRKALLQSPNFEASAARVRVAQAEASLMRSQFAPMTGLTFQTSHQDVPLVNAAGASGDLIDLGFGFQLPIDLFGRKALTRAISNGMVDERIALEQALKIRLTRDVAIAVVRLRALDQDAQALSDIVTSAKALQTLQSTKTSMGDGSDLDVARAEAETARVLAEASGLRLQRALLVHQLASLLGEDPGHFDWPRQDTNVRLSISLDVTLADLSGRPDVLAAARRVDSARASLNLTEKEALPSLSLTGQSGQASSTLANLVRPDSAVWGMGLQLASVLFPDGRHKARNARAVAELEEASANYRQSVLQAAQEVADVLSEDLIANEKASAMAQAENAAGRVFRAAELRYQDGSISQIERLIAQRDYAQSQRGLVAANLARDEAAIHRATVLAQGV